MQVRRTSAASGCSPICPGCSPIHLSLRGGERGAVEAVALAGEHCGGAHLRCIGLQPGLAGLQAGVRRPDAEKDAAGPPTGSRRGSGRPGCNPVWYRLQPYVVSAATHPQEAVEEEVSQVAAAAAAARLQDTGLQPLVHMLAASTAYAYKL